MLNSLISGKEKAVLGGLSAGVLALLGQLGVNSNLTIKEGVYAAITWLGTHFVIWLTTNSDVVFKAELGKVETEIEKVVPKSVLNGVEQLARGKASQTNTTLTANSPAPLAPADGSGVAAPTAGTQ